MFISVTRGSLVYKKTVFYYTLETCLKEFLFLQTHATS
jgi:hypothetical protein